MLTQNLKEYEFLRYSVESTKDRLTKQMSFAIGGSGVAFIAISSLESSRLNNLALGLACMFSATLLAAFLYMSCYKFYSINRYLGYCKLINLEIFAGLIDVKAASLPEASKLPEHFIFWEVCISKLANTKKTTSFEENYWKNVLKYNFKDFDINKLKVKFEELNLLKPKADEGAFWKGVTLLFKGISQKDKSKSWKFPLYSSYVYYILIFFFIALSILNIIQFYSTEKEICSVPTEIIYGLSILILFLFLATLKALHVSTSYLYCLMVGTKTVSAFCWTFLPYRIRILNKFNIKPTYYITEK